MVKKPISTTPSSIPLWAVEKANEILQHLRVQVSSIARDYLAAELALCEARGKNRGLNIALEEAKEANRRRVIK